MNNFRPAYSLSLNRCHSHLHTHLFACSVLFCIMKDTHCAPNNTSNTGFKAAITYALSSTLCLRIFTLSFIVWRARSSKDDICSAVLMVPTIQFNSSLRNLHFKWLPEQTKQRYSLFVIGKPKQALGVLIFFVLKRHYSQSWIQSGRRFCSLERQLKSVGLKVPRNARNDNDSLKWRRRRRRRSREQIHVGLLIWVSQLFFSLLQFSLFLVLVFFPWKSTLCVCDFFSTHAQVFVYFCTETCICWEQHYEWGISHWKLFKCYLVPSNELECAFRHASFFSFVHHL